MTDTSTSQQTFLSPSYYRNFITWIFGHIINHKRHLILGYLFLFLGTGISVIIPFILQYFFDVAIYVDWNTVLIVGFVFLGLYVFNLLFGVLGAWINAIYSEKVVRDVQVEFFESIHSKSMSFHDSARTGELLSMATSDSRQLSWMLLSILTFSLAVFTAITSLVAMYLLDVRLFTIFLLFIPPIVVGMIHHGKQLGPVSIERQKKFGKWQATLQENLSGIRALRTLSNRELEFQKYDDDLKSVREILIKRGIISARYYPTLILYLAMGVLFIVGSILVTQGEVSPGTVIALNSLVLLLQGPSEFIRFTIFLGSMGFAGGKRVFNVISEHQQLEDGEVELKRRLEGKIEFRNVSFRYGPQSPDVLKDISFTIQPGQTVAVIGHTGCGKTTLQNLIQRLYNPTQGAILIDEVDIRQYPLDRLRRQIGVIEQDIFLFSASIKENILYGCGSDVDPALEEKMMQVAKAAQIHDFIMTLPKGYDTIIGERGITLSGGQRQRLAIARAFMINPPILIMDDSTSAIDAKTEAEIQIAIRNLLESRTTLIVTHRLSTLRKADVVILMGEGKILDIGAHKDLYFRNTDYAEIFRQFENLPSIPEELLVSPQEAI
ncbi:MAG: ABC transporter ATP-binding protein [Candidatus Heimdallarchaeota archaeon]|nr:MAG: ABC transporter ATP-binding protein [Candidatus Heimdallarchaeota archaeon]